MHECGASGAGIVQRAAGDAALRFSGSYRLHGDEVKEKPARSQLASSAQFGHFEYALSYYYSRSLAARGPLRLNACCFAGACVHQSTPR
eukprot:6006764-Prymnesium_polylepis.1